MSLVSRSFLFGLPAYTAYKAYAQARFELPMSIGFGHPTTLYKTDPRYAEVLKQLPGGHIKDEIKSFLHQSEIRKDLIVVEQYNSGFCTAGGTNIFTKSDAVVLVAPGLHKTDKDACHFVMKHEISHIKNNDLFTMNCVPCVCQVVASIFGMRFLSFRSALMLVWIVGLVSEALFSMWREAKADDFAIKNSSDGELKGGRRVFITMKEANIEERNTTLWKQLIISASGERRLDIFHPSFTSRIQKIEGALQKRNVAIEIERQMIDDLKAIVKLTLRICE
ncbi:MAG: M48 family metalloprotease [Rhabdochlamydiaceae bacterium]|jgi:Zn-dependent protease with chaperone function